ncbi:helix-turn-helix domain-containing protein [Methanococcoides sp. AM1]|uniref:AlbA family DNA-binding domain-containing protein n=1 Tax=Methanococcoides sp. AM1 TaxID=1201011 RepID=UPI0014382CD6|nr:ATP-binding protein [Methanococcoides sp. AM1]
MSLEKEVLKLIENGENPAVEFKQKEFINKGQDVARTLSSFANYNGGKVLLGVTDDCKIEGVTIGNKDIERIMGSSSKNCHPPIEPEVKIVNFDEGDVAYINIPKARRPIKANEKWYIRHGNTTRTMELDELLNYPGIEITSVPNTIDIESILTRENNQHIIYEDSREVPYIESKTFADVGDCIIYANTFNHFYRKAYYLDKLLPRITINDLRKIIEKYYSIFQVNHNLSAFGICQEEYNWFGHGPLNFLDALEKQDHRYAKLKKNNRYIHHRESACFVDELDNAIFYIHAQPNSKRTADEEITLDYLTVGFVFSSIPYDNIYRDFFESIGFVPNFIEEVDEDLSSVELLQSDFKGDDYVIDNFERKNENWVCGLIGKKSDNRHIPTFYTDKILVNLNQYHLIEDKYKHKISRITSTKVPVGGFQALIVDYEGRW